MVASLPTNSTEHNMKSLIELGTKGLYPLFHQEWIEKAGELRKQKITGQDRVNNRAIAKTLSKHKNLERKQIVLMALEEDERNKFIIDFLQKVETKILEGKPEIQ